MVVKFSFDRVPYSRSILLLYLNYVIIIVLVNARGGSFFRFKDTLPTLV